MVECPKEWKKKEILKNGPYMMEGSGFFIKDWEPNFNPLKQEVENIPQWLRLYYLALEY